MPSEKGYRSTFDPLVVNTADLKIVLERFIIDFKARHDGKVRIHKRVYGSVGGYEEKGWEDRLDISSQEGYVSWICRETGVSPRRLWGILHLQSKHTSLDLADQILQGLEMTYVYHNGEVPVIPNPRWNQERWIKWMSTRGLCDGSD
jgi:hypothetical protein